MNSFLTIHPEVREAIKENKPIVALESTIISHGMPYPQNLETAMEVENIVRNNGAIPATIAIINGKCHAGLSKEQLEVFASEKNIIKVSLRDMPFVIAKKQYGATTVAATMRIASWAGIKFFVTGGIGGVHREAETTLDISADLTELSQTSVAVISAGVKSILDIGLTLEYLETLGVPVITYGQKEFPSFYSRKSGFDSPMNSNDLNEIANIISTKWQMGLNGGILIANPVPEKDEIVPERIEEIIQSALASAKEKNTKGKDITPYLLSFIADNSEGESLMANIALIKNNAKVGALLATSFVKIN